MLNIYGSVVPHMTETSSDRSHLTQEQQALSIVVASSPDVALAAFERTLSSLPSDRKLPVAVQQQILELVESDADLALKIVIGIQNAGIGKGMGIDEKGKKIGQIIELLKDDQLKSDPKFIADLIQVCTYDDDSDPVSVAALINQGWSVTKIIKLQEAGKSVDAVALSDHREKLFSLIEKEKDNKLLILITDVCNLLAGVQGSSFKKEIFIDRLSPVAASVPKEELTSLLEDLKLALESPKDGQIINFDTNEFAVARTLRLI